MCTHSPAYYSGLETVATGRRSSSFAFYVCAFIGALVFPTLLASCSDPTGEQGWGVGSEDKVCGQPGEILSGWQVAELEECTVLLGGVRTLGCGEEVCYSLPPLRVIEGELTVMDCPPEHRRLHEFDHLERIGGNLKILYCLGLEDLSGLSRLEHVEGDVEIISNNATLNNNRLSNLKGLEGLRSIGGEVYISSNMDLESLDGLDNLESVTEDVIVGYNDLLTSLSGLSNLKQIGGKLSVFVNPMLTSFDGLENVTTLGELYISNNQGLHSLEGLSGLQRVRGDVQITNNENLPQNEIDALLARIQVDGEVILD